MQSDYQMDGGSAIWAKNAAAFEKALENGWTLPQATIKSGGYAKDITLILRIVSSNWVEGWTLLLKHMPEFSRNMIVAEAVLSQARHEILAEMIRVNDGSLPWHRTEDDLLPPHLMFQLIGSQMGRQADSDDIIATLKILELAGFDAQAVYPGDFEIGAWSPPGHTIWTWALLWAYWDVAEGLDVQDEAFEMPQGIIALDRWFEKAWVPDWVSEAGDGLKMGAEYARKTWLEWMSDDRFKRWSSRSELTKNIALYEPFSCLPQAYQTVLWQGWLSSNGEWSGLHDLVSSLLSINDIESVLNKIKQHVPNEKWEDGWNGEDAYGMSARLIWEEKRA